MLKAMSKIRHKLLKNSFGFRCKYLERTIRYFKYKNKVKWTETKDQWNCI